MRWGEERGQFLLFFSPFFLHRDPPSSTHACVHACMHLHPRITHPLSPLTTNTHSMVCVCEPKIILLLLNPPPLPLSASHFFLSCIPSCTRSLIFAPPPPPYPVLCAELNQDVLEEDSPGGRAQGASGVTAGLVDMDDLHKNVQVISPSSSSSSSFSFLFLFSSFGASDTQSHTLTRRRHWGDSAHSSGSKWPRQRIPSAPINDSLHSCLLDVGSMIESKINEQFFFL